MDEIELLVEETYKHFENIGAIFPEMKSFAPISKEQNDVKIPEKPGVIYHIQKSSSVFVMRTLVSQNINEDYLRIVQNPGNYPSLRLLEEGEENVPKKLKFFILENPSEAEIIHDQLHNRRFPIFEEMMCNLSDPGFSWWLTKKNPGFQLAFTMSVSSDNNTIKLGPLGDREMAIRKFQVLEKIITAAGININIQNEMNRVAFTDSEEFILEELKVLFEFGILTKTFKDLFKILSRQNSDTALLEDVWYYLHELGAMRRFWIQIQCDLNSDF
jgi:hypothetical protein